MPKTKEITEAPQRVVITITDEPDEAVSVSMEFVPEVDDDTRSKAVFAALEMMKVLHSD